MSRVDVFGLVLVKRFTYRGDTGEEWSNKYWFSGPIPNTSSEFKAQADQLIVDETTCYTSACHVVRAYGYDAWETDPNAPVIPSVWSYDYAAAGQEVQGSLTSATGRLMSGDQVGEVFWLTDRRTSNGKPIYCRKYFHSGFVDATNMDHISTETRDAYGIMGAKYGVVPALPGLGHVRAAAADAPILNSGASINVSIHQLKRRGKRPLVQQATGSATSAATPS